MKNILVLAAIPDELDGLFDDVPHVVFTGVGKINAAWKTAEALRAHRPEFVINLGTAASAYSRPGSFVQPIYFRDRDMDCTALGFPKGSTPFETGSHVIGPGKHELEGVTCYSGDSFLKAKEVAKYSGVVDMEAYAIARVVSAAGLSFMCLKYITDGRAKDAKKSWKDKVREGASGFRKIYDHVHHGAPLE